MNLLRLLLIALLSGLSIAIANADKPRETPYPSFILTGQVYNMPAGGSKTLLVNECDYSSTSARQVVEFDKEGRFSAIVPINYGHTFTVNYSGNFINAYAEPNDSINIEIDASQSPMSFKLSGSHAELNEEFSHSRVWLTPYLNNIKLPNDTVSISEFMPAFESEVNSLQAIINKYVEENRISDEVADMLRTESLYTISNLASGYRGKGKEDKIAFTWCGSCRVAIASSEGVREHFKETDIVFAIIWLRSDLEEWKKIVPEIKNAMHIFISDEATTNQLMGKLNLVGFPSYYLITKNSEIRTDIPNYKSAELPDFLNSLIN